MNLKSILFTGLCLITTQLNAGMLYQFNNQPLTVNRCNLIETGGVLDLAINNDGYFVVSEGKKESDLLFTRSGHFCFNAHGYIVTFMGDYLLGINKKSDPNLRKLRVFMDNMLPKATTKANIKLNLPSNSSRKESFETAQTIYDNISGAHSLNIIYTQSESNTWTVQASIDGIKRDKGILIFKSDGRLNRQEGLSHVQWPSNNGLKEIKIDHTGSTQFAAPYSIQAVYNNGYTIGSLVTMNIDMNGEIILIYSNGQTKALKNRIAIAKFANPDYLENVIHQLFRATEKSGPPRLHAINSKGAILSGYLEEEFCLAR